MPFVKVSRDKRGYEQISLVHVSARRGRPSKARVLYVFRTPPGVKVGREPFDEAVQRELEAQNPGVVFDWKMLSNIPAPAPDVEFWRERRKADKAAKLARKAEEQADAAEELDAIEPVSADVAAGLAAIEDLVCPDAPAADPGNQGLPIDDGLDVVPADGVLIDSTVEIAAPGASGYDGRPPAPRRRQRRGGRRRHRGSPPVPAPSEDQDTRRFQAEAPVSIQASIEGPLQVSSASEESEAGPSKLARDTSKEA